MEDSYKQIVWGVAIISLIFRAFLAASVDLGNDEVYYWTYALYPDWSHFDHPPMVGWFIQLFSFDLLFDSELFVRMSSVITGFINTFIIASIASKIGGKRAGIFAAILYNTSVYTFIITGTFILPDTPQVFFWLISLKMMVDILPYPEMSWAKKRILLMGVFIGLAILSKYTSVFLWGGAGLYILLYKRKWFANPQLYIAILISGLFVIPVAYWNLQYDFISFTYHGGRVTVTDNGVNWNTFFSEVIGQFAYNNPINFIIIWIAVVAALRNRIRVDRQKITILLLNAIPLILVFLGASLFRRTLPHWTGPGYLSLIILAALWLGEIKSKQSKRWLSSAASLLVVALCLAFAHINYGVFDSYTINKDEVEYKLGKNEPSLDMYGWDQIHSAMEKLIDEDLEANRMDDDFVFLSNKWFPAAHLDYYVASPLDRNLLVIGKLYDSHKYDWINIERGGFKIGQDAYFIATSLHFVDAQKRYKKYYESIELAKKIEIIRNGGVVKNVYVYRMKDLKKIPESELMTFQRD